MSAAPAGPGPLDVLVLGSGVAGLSAAVRLAAPLTPAGGSAESGNGLRVGVHFRPAMFRNWVGR